MSRDPVVITGVGLVSPLGPDRESSWKALLSGGCAAVPGGARVPVAETDEPRALRFARLAAVEALLDAGVKPPLGERTGVSVSGSKPLLDAPTVLAPEVIAQNIAATIGAQGPVVNFSAACATGAISVISAAQWIQEGRCDAVLAGAAESSFHPLYETGFSRMGVLSQRGKVRPFDRTRDGFIMGEGAGVFYLETASSARKRGARVYGAVSGWGAGCDARDVVRFHENGSQVSRVLSQALRRAGLPPEQVDYVNAHGTATALNDALEARALASVFPGERRPLVSSTKGATGHLLGATGAVELGFCLLALRDGRVPPTLHLEDPETDHFDFVPGRAREAALRRAATVSFGFGGAIAAVVLEKP